MTEQEFAEQIEQAGGRLYVVGGWVRDTIRGTEPHDKDYVVTGVSEAAFESLYPDARRMGKRFPVYRLRVGAMFREVAFARHEVKTGPGHRGFDVMYDGSVTIQDDLERRDTTVNSMAVLLGSGAGPEAKSGLGSAFGHEFAPELGRLIDPFGGAEDIARRIIRATSKHFTDDPVRALRAARQSAQFDYSIEPDTIRQMIACRSELRDEPTERIMHELRLALETDKPSVFFLALLESDLLDATFPWLQALVGIGEDEDADEFVRAMQALDDVAAISDRPEIRFAALTCRIGPEPDPEEEQRREEQRRADMRKADLRQENLRQEEWRREERRQEDRRHGDRRQNTEASDNWQEVERRQAVKRQGDNNHQGDRRQEERRLAAAAYSGLEVFLGLQALEDWNKRMPLPGLWMACAKFAIKESSRVDRLSRPGEIADFLSLLERHPIGTDGIIAVMSSGGHKIPPFLRRSREYYRAMREVSGHDIPEDLTGPRRGQWLRARRIESVAKILM